MRPVVRPMHAACACVQVRTKHGAWEGFDIQDMRDHFASLPNHQRESKPKAE